MPLIKKADDVSYEELQSMSSREYLSFYVDRYFTSADAIIVMNKFSFKGKVTDFAFIPYKSLSEAKKAFKAFKPLHSAKILLCSATSHPDSDKKMLLEEVDGTLSTNDFIGFNKNPSVLKEKKLALDLLSDFRARQELMESALDPEAADRKLAEKEAKEAAEKEAKEKERCLTFIKGIQYPISELLKLVQAPIDASFMRKAKEFIKSYNNLSSILPYKEEYLTEKQRKLAKETAPKVIAKAEQMIKEIEAVEEPIRQKSRAFTHNLKELIDQLNIFRKMPAEDIPMEKFIAAIEQQKALAEEALTMSLSQAQSVGIKGASRFITEINKKLEDNREVIGKKVDEKRVEEDARSVDELEDAEDLERDMNNV